MSRPLRRRACPLPLSALVCLSVPAISHAQERPSAAATPGAVPASAADVLRGAVRDTVRRPIAGAAVVVTRGPDRLVQTATADSAGRWTLRFTPGTGDYLVTVSAAGYRSVRRRVQRASDERTFDLTFTLTPGLATLAAVQVTAKKPERADNSIDRYGPATAAEQSAEGISGQVSPTDRGDLTAGLVGIPGLTLTPGGLSVLGTSAAQNLTTLNGMALPLGTLPRAARTETRVASAPFDPARGGFSGANIDVRLGPGDRDYQNRNAYLSLVPAPLQATDAIGRATGARQAQLRTSVGADGELIRRALTYNVALDAARTRQDQVSLLTADPRTLGVSGVAPRAVMSLVQLAGRGGLPLGAAGTSVQRTNVTWLGRLDDTRDTLARRSLTSFAGLTRADGLGLDALAAPSVTSAQEQATVGAQLATRDFVGPGRRVLTEVKLSANLSRTRTTPALLLPGANVLLPAAPIGDALGGVSGGPGTLADSAAVSAVQVAGNGGVPRADRRWTLEGLSETVWLAGGRTHRFRATAWGRYDGLRQEAAGDLLGRWAYNSLADLEANRPAGFTRQLTAPVRSGASWNAATSLSHQWNRSRTFNVLYGARLEAGGFAAPPAGNPLVAATFGLASRPPTTLLHVSPRLGFSWTYSRAKDNTPWSFGTGYGTFNRGPTGTLRGGIGEFRDLVRPEFVASARANTGLSDGTTLLSCVGAATPLPDWTRLDNDPAAIPTRCAGGTGPTPLAETAPSVTVLDRSWRPPRSWRAALDWSSVLGTWTVRANTLASLDLNQPGLVDLNFSGVERFALGAEGGRRVYATPAAIDPRTGVVSAVPSRASAAFGGVVRQASDLRGYGGQLTLTAAPALRPRADGRRRFPRVYTDLTYTLQTARRQFRGFDGAAAGDPRVVEWAPSPNDARHVFLWQLGTSGDRLGTLTLFARFQSGLPYTPLVGGDVNGDGRGYDRAFVPAVGAAGDSALAAQLATLSAGGAPGARACLDRFAGRIATRNGCRGPWTQLLNLQWQPSLPKRWRTRVTPNVYVENLLGGLDQMLHGGGALRGWGPAATPDPVLLVPRGFDAAAGRFRYGVNPRFGDTRPANIAFRAPVRLTIDFSVDLSVPQPVQRLRRALEPVRDRPGTMPGAVATAGTPPGATGPGASAATARGGWRARTPDEILALYLDRTSSLPKLVLAESDSLLLTREQMAALWSADSLYSDSVIAIYQPLAGYLATRERAGAEELKRAEEAEKAYWRTFWHQPEIVNAILTPVQRELLPMMKILVAEPPSRREFMKWYLGNPVRLPKPASGQTAR